MYSKKIYTNFQIRKKNSKTDAQLRVPLDRYYVGRTEETEHLKLRYV